MTINARFILRALAISLLFHAWLLLQAPPRVSLPVSTSLEAELRPTAKAEAQTLRAKPPSNKQPSARATPAARDIASVAPARDAAMPSAARASPLSGLDLAEARKSYVFALVHEARRVRQTALSGLAQDVRVTSEVRVAVNADGVPQALLQTSSGDARIDDAALTLVSAALARTPVPEDLRGAALDLVLPLRFGD